MAIGLVTVQWTHVEQLVEHLVWELGNLQQPSAQAITTHIAFNQLIDMANALAAERIGGTSLQERLKAQLNYITNQLRPIRNKMVHGVWGPSIVPGKVVLMETTARGVVKFKVGEELAPIDIRRVAADIDAAAWELGNLTFEIASHLGQVTTIDLGSASDSQG